MTAGFDALWQQLENHRYISEYRQGWTDKEWILNKARQRIREARELAYAVGDIEGTSPPGRKKDTQTQGLPAELGEDENERTQAFSEVQARMADTDADVVRFRMEVLGGQLLTAEQARDVLAGDNFWPDGSVRRPEALRDDLRSLSERLANSYRWQVKDAVCFVLTGHTPRVSPFRIETFHKFEGGHPRSAIIALTLEPWISAKEVARVYRNLQRQMLGKDNRPISKRNLRLLRFVEEQIRANGKRPAWRTLMERWNDNYPAWEFKDVRNFQYLYSRTFNHVVHPRHNYPSGQKPDWLENHFMGDTN